MLEMGTSGLMSGDGKRGGFNVSTRVRPRLYNRKPVLVGNLTLTERHPSIPFTAGRLFGAAAGTAARRSQ
jgi:hypothetical protein